MDREQEKQYEDLREMFNSEGWKVFIGEIEEKLKASVDTAPDTCINNDQWQFRKGEIFQLRQIANLETYIDAIMEMGATDA